MSLTFGQVTDILMLANAIPDERKATFVSRLKQWQKMGFPEGVNVGRGVRVSYDATQLFQLALHMRLLVIGLTPERAQLIVTAAWKEFRSSVVDVTIRKAKGDEDYCYLLIQYDALTELKEGRTGHSHIYVRSIMDWMIVDAFQGLDELPEEDKASFEFFQMTVRDVLVNAIVLEIDSIIMRIWIAMTKLGISAQAISSEISTWAADPSAPPTSNNRSEAPDLIQRIDNLSGVEMCPGCFAADLLGLGMHEHGGSDGNAA